MLSIGDAVISKKGHDKGGIFAVIKTCGQYVYIADGRHRKLQNAKKKLAKHVQVLNGEKADCTTNKALWKSLEIFRNGKRHDTKEVNNV